MTQSELVDLIADRAGLTKRDAQRAVGVMIDGIQEALARGDDVSFTGFGRFTVTTRAARQGVNPRTGERVHIAERKAPRFTPGSRLREAVARR
jgi:DNA-binding protein HU-beta